MFCFHASHEQFAPSRLVKLAVMAERAGFDGIHSSDHFHPWSKNQGNSGFSFSWLGAAMQATSLPFSVVCAPGQRYHPAIVAQAAATLAEMFPGRFDIELGSGEALNEMITGESWPSKQQRNERLLESANTIRKLLKGEEVTHRGLINVRKAKIYSLPPIAPLLYAAAVSKETTEWAGSWADGLLTTGGDIGQTQKKIEAFYSHGGKGKPVTIQISFSFANTEEEAAQGAFDQWRSNIVPMEKLENVHTPDQFDELAKSVTLEDVKASIKIFTSIEKLMDWLKPNLEIGVTKIFLHNIHPDQEYFIERFAEYKIALNENSRK